MRNLRIDFNAARARMVPASADSGTFRALSDVEFEVTLTASDLEALDRVTIRDMLRDITADDDSRDKLADKLRGEK